MARSIRIPTLSARRHSGRTFDKIVRGEILEERYGKANLLAHKNLYEEFVVAAVFLLAPHFGACQARSGWQDQQTEARRYLAGFLS